MMQSEYIKQYRAQKRRNGECYQCHEPARIGKTLCAEHAAIKQLKRRA